MKQVNLMAYSNSTKISITLPADLLGLVDEIADKYYFSRSEIIKIALIKYIRASHLNQAQQVEIINKVNRERVLDEYLMSQKLDKLI